MNKVLEQVSHVHEVAQVANYTVFLLLLTHLNILNANLKCEQYKVDDSDRHFPCFNQCLIWQHHFNHVIDGANQVQDVRYKDQSKDVALVLVPEDVEQCLCEVSHVEFLIIDIIQDIDEGQEIEPVSIQPAQVK